MEFWDGREHRGGNFWSWGRRVGAKSHAEGPRHGADLYVSRLFRRDTDRDKKGYPRSENPAPLPLPPAGTPSQGQRVPKEGISERKRRARAGRWQRGEMEVGRTIRGGG